MSSANAVEVQKLWPTTFYAFRRPDHAAEAPELIAYLYRLREEQKAAIASRVAPSAKSGEGLFESDFDLLSRDHATIRNLREFIIRSVQMTASHVNGGQVPPNQIEVDIVDGWYHITNDGGFHDAHYHGGCSWCGVYYVQLGDSGVGGKGAPNGGARFYSPLGAGGTYNDFGNRYLNAGYIDAPVTDGTLLLFPSYLLHSGLPYRGGLDRIVIAFNSRSAVRET